MRLSHALMKCLMRNIGKVQRIDEINELAPAEN
jgi:hypothetical protein